MSSASDRSRDPHRIGFPPCRGFGFEGEGIIEEGHNRAGGGACGGSRVRIWGYRGDLSPPAIEEDREGAGGVR
jgi:hypothetical protein